MKIPNGQRQYVLTDKCNYIYIFYNYYEIKIFLRMFPHSTLQQMKRSIDLPYKSNLYIRPCTEIYIEIKCTL
jgi:hypothetical protein